MDSCGAHGKVVGERGARAAVPSTTRLGHPRVLLGCHTLFCLVLCVLHLLLIMLMRDVSCVVKLVMSKILLSKKAWNGNSVGPTGHDVVWLGFVRCSRVRVWPGTTAALLR